MKDLIFKIRLLKMFFGTAIAEYKAVASGDNLDRSYCCDGHDCGCGGATNRELYQDVMKSNRKIDKVGTVD